MNKVEFLFFLGYFYFIYLFSYMHLAHGCKFYQFIGEKSYNYDFFYVFERNFSAHLHLFDQESSKKQYNCEMFNFYVTIF